MPKIDISAHLALEEAGFLHINRHAELPLMIHNYSPKAQYERHWTPETLLSRGLVTDLEGHIVARPFGKFFNLDEHVGLYGSLPDEPFEVYEKMDGSLGILFHYEGQLQIVTRGSFHSEQALIAQRIFKEKYQHVALSPNQTYLVEIIYPSNRIVVNYGEMTDLVLLAVLETKTGDEIPLEDIGLPLVKRYHGIRDLAALRQSQPDNREGYVIRFESGLRVKLKFDEYVRLHRIITGINTRVIWEELKNGNSLEALLEDVPDEFYQWVKKEVKALHDAYAKIETQVQSEFKHFDDRKSAAAYFRAHTQYPAIMFKLLDQKPYSEIIWKLIRPVSEKPFSEEENS